MKNLDILEPIVFKRGQQTVETPKNICEDIISKIRQYIHLENKKIAILFNPEFLQTLQEYKFNINNIHFFVDDKVKCALVNKKYKLRNLYLINYDNLNKEFINMKFDVVIGNPPYQGTTGNKGKGNILWDKFLLKSVNELVKDDGYVSLIHPSLWRKPNHELQKIFLENNLKYLEIHDHKDGKKYFGANTRYDWYILQKNSKYDETEVVGQDGKRTWINVKEMSFIPNCQFDLVKKLLAKDNEERVEILHSESAYEHRKEWISKEENEVNCYPCIYMVKKEELSFRWSSRKDKGHFGIPKIIYGSGEGCMKNFYPDYKGEYGMTQWASGIVDDPKNFDKIIRSLQTNEFQSLLSAICVSKIEINTSVLRLFKKDFWKEFI